MTAATTQPGVGTDRREVPVTTLQQLLDSVTTIGGVLGTALVETETGMTLGTAGGSDDLDLELASAGATEMVRAQVRAQKTLGHPERFHEVLATLPTTLHIVRPVAPERGDGLFLYLIFDRAASTLTQARRQLAIVESQLAF